MEVANDLLRIVFKHRHMVIRSLAESGLGSHGNALAHLLIAQRPQATCLLSVEIQLCRILNAQHHLVRVMAQSVCAPRIAR